MSHGIQQPLFASASAQSQGDDFDLNEIFAEYFISEFENPVNAYTNSMGNYVAGPGNAAVAVAAPAPAITVATNFAPAPAGQHQHLQQPGLSSGIRTPYHSAVVAPAPTSASVQPQHQQPQSMGLPIAKRAKLEPGITKPPTMTANVAVTGGITSRLGFNTGHLQGGNTHTQGGTALQMGGGRGGILPGGVPGTMTLAQQQQGSFGQHQQQVSGVGVALPVGRGIRLGGAGGVAPATAQKVPGVGGMIWGGPQMMGMSDQAVAERRQRNREHAKRSRVRKKFMLESLQEQVAALQRENARLRVLVQDNIPEHAQMIISECCTSSPLFGDADANGSPQISGEGESGEGKSKTTALVRSDFQLIDSLSAGQQNFVLSDPRLPDNPIVFATPGFYKLTGYTMDQVLGRNCRFLQGSGTDPKSVDIVRKAIQSGSDCTVCILNYKADGTPFWNQFFVAALRDADNCIVNYVGVQTEIEPDAGANALEDRVNAVMPLANKEDDEEE